MRLLENVLSLVTVCGVAACGTDGSDVDISDGTLMGSVAGEPWTFVMGHTNAFLSEDDDDFFAVLFASPFTACGSEPAGDNLIVSVPKEPGDYGFNLSRNMTFVEDADDGPNNLIATEGRIIVTEVTDTSVTGGLHGIFDGDNEVDGQFTLTVCAN